MMAVFQAVLLLMAGLSLAGPVHAAAPLEACGAEYLNLMPAVQMFEDPQASLSLEDITRLPEERFTPVSTEQSAQGYSHSAFWLRLQLKNSASENCSRLLVLGPPHLQDIRVYQRQVTRWSLSRGGRLYTLEKRPFPTRQATFQVSLPAGAAVDLLVRVTSDSQILLAPQLWSKREVLQSQQRSYLKDGLSLGIVALLVPFSLAVGWIMGSRLLVIHAGTVLGYILLTCILNGYLLYWPAMLAWTRELMTLVSLVSFTFFLAYIWVLLQVSRLPHFFAWLYSLFLLGYVASRLWGLAVDPVQGAVAVQILLKVCLYVLLPITLFSGWRKGLAYSWVAWLVPGLYVLQFMARYLFQLDQIPWQSPHDRYSLSSTLPGAALLICTLIAEVSSSRAREKNALVSLDQQRQAEHERMEITVAQRTVQLHESLAARSALMARISHDLRSPLISIIDYSRRLRAEPNTQYSQNIERNARQQLELIDELLEFSRGESEDLELTYAPGYLYKFLREIEEEAGFLASRQDNAFGVVLPDDLPVLVHADFKRLRQILMNLLVNAAKFTHKGEIRLVVRRCIAEEQGTVVLRFSVIDTGIGIDPAELEQLLQPFSRGRNAQRYDGSGLGLSIVSRMLQRMNSRLEAEVTEQGGSRFSFRLQLESAREQDMDSALADNHCAPFDGQGRHILLVDDIEQNLEWLYDLLAGYGFDVSLAASGEAALACLSEQTVDLVISDQMMPGMDGWDLLQQIRDHWPILPVILYSAAPARSPKNYPEDLAFDAVLLKPAGSSELLACIEILTCGVLAKERLEC